MILVTSPQRKHVVLFALVSLVCVSLLVARHSDSLPLLPSSLLHETPVWLIATVSPAHSQQRRNIIRATWQTLHRIPRITTKFILSNPGELWMPLIERENSTYGDLIVLPRLEESAEIANTIKSIEFLNHLVTSGRSWKFVSKLDDDSYLDVSTFYHDYILPRLEDKQDNHTMIGRHMDHWEPDFEYPGGQFYTLSWELVQALARLYRQNPIADEHEDVLIGRLLHEGNETFDFVDLDNSKAFDYDEESEDMWGAAHRVVKGAINPHKMKDDETYLKVASMYDHNGVKSG